MILFCGSLDGTMYCVCGGGGHYMYVIECMALFFEAWNVWNCFWSQFSMWHTSFESSVFANILRELFGQ